MFKDVYFLFICVFYKGWKIIKEITYFFKHLFYLELGVSCYCLNNTLAEHVNLNLNSTINKRK